MQIMSLNALCLVFISIHNLHLPSSPSTSGKTHEKTSVIQTRRLQFDVFLRLVDIVCYAAKE